MNVMLLKPARNEIETLGSPILPSMRVNGLPDPFISMRKLRVDLVFESSWNHKSGGKPIFV